MSTQAAIHNRLAPEIVRQIVKGPLDAGGSIGDVLVVLESVVMGVVLMTVRLGGDEAVLDTMMAGVKARLAKDRLEHIQTAGRG